MLILGIVVGWGTVVESRYNSDYANLLIYKSAWFNVLLILLWINIFCATVSRIPFKFHHIGFVVTHIGLLTLLFGGFLTNKFGIDGQLSIMEKQSTRSFVVSDLMVGYQYEGETSLQKKVFAKALGPKDKEDFAAINTEIGHIIQIEKYFPFAKVQRTFISDSQSSDEIALSFILKSQFFNVNEWLNTRDNPEIQMGPATLRLVKVDSLKNQKRFVAVGFEAAHKTVNHRHKVRVKDEDKLIVATVNRPDEVKEFRISDIPKAGIEVSGVKIKIQNKYKSAIVAGNKLKENADSTSDNPALELIADRDGKELREVLYAKFQDFSLHKEGVFGFKFLYQAVSSESNESPDPELNTEMKPQNIPSGSRVIEFRVSPSEPGAAEIVLYKEGKVVQSAKLVEGEKLVTPWMGIEIFLGSLKFNAVASSDVSPVNPEKRKELPPSAIFVSQPDGKKFWLTEGDSKNLVIGERGLSIYFGKELMELPFDISLDKFTKYDYPGTDTAMSYESLVRVGSSNELTKISMNTPFKQDGYTLYQASYIANPNEPAVSIFSVNKDPGRVLKYLGSIILGIGIIIFTLMKSRLHNNKIIKAG
ncbi:MAG: cytochrome c biogenesis protein ResB [Bdellovibrio sp.]